MEIKDFECKVYDNIIEITMNEPIEENVSYEFIFEEVQSAAKDKSIKRETVNITTALTPMHTTIGAVQSLLHTAVIDNTTILYNIREASRFVEFATETSYAAGQVPYAAGQYVKYRAAYESVLKKYSEITELAGKKGAIGKVSFENVMPNLKPLLEELKEQMLKWELQLVGVGRAKFNSAIKGIGARYEYGGMPNNYARGAMNGMARPRYPKYY